MGHKSSPISMRLGITREWSSRWFDAKNYKDFLKEDFLIRDFVSKKFSKASIENVDIERHGNTLKVMIKTSRPGILIGRGGQGAELIKKGIQATLGNHDKNKSKREIKIAIEEIRSPFSCAGIVAQNLADQLERRVPYRRAMKQILEKVKEIKEVKGVKIMAKGRLNGAEIARDEWLKSGSLPLQNLRADIDFAKVTAYTTYGTIGIKVWLYKGEKFD